MPLLDVVGVSSFNGSFYSCFAFLRKEEENEYIWALKRFKKILDGIQPQIIVFDQEIVLLNAIKIVFPNTGHLLCIWHIEKNILAKCKRFFDDKEGWDTFLLTWTNLIQSPDKLSFCRNMSLFEAQYADRGSLLNYMNTAWIPYKERFVFAWTNNFMHLGNHVTSRAEGAHTVLKQYLNISTGDFRDVKDKISLAIENQYQEIKIRVASEKVRIPHKFRIPLFQEFICHISVFALSQLYKKYGLATMPGVSTITCKSHFSNSMGLPCAHKIRELDKEGILHLNEIHPQWRIDTKSFLDSNTPLNDRNDDIDVLLKEFRDKYHNLPLVQK
ncbi:protein FAR-RED IMPAIRED RESPONSE 1-like [Apium graveolens]|uniref:protein FAR-RED IMPAIRED RESPONSE 1-like n=1 Tax=Apium graveolens TaxID=4045 RepID=UPI003D7C10EA